MLPPASFLSIPAARRTPSRRAGLHALVLAVVALTATAAVAQQPPARPAQGGPPPLVERADKIAITPVVVPNFWNVERRLERPDAAKLPKELRFVTTDDYPPFNFINSTGALSGFNIDLARAICAELSVTCSFQTAAFADVADVVDQGRAEAAIAGLVATPASRATLDFSERYLGTPARFVGRKQEILAKATPEEVASKKVAVVSRTAHEAYLRSFFNEAAIRPYPDLKAAQEALKAGQVDLLFGDGITLALWLNGTDSAACCRFVGGPFTESRFFGDGFSVAVKEGNDTLRHAVDFALQRIWEKGVYTDLYLRWFPVGFY
ncbi:polar amino acid transport system substrate-binding protein [Xanthobacter sp. SG618]|uniref:transporter substrate-binding domain-containing protein n=1 Tax=Xanthobacter sp. SG618 TaxID=2587121 RepID=UPI0017B82901|nr:transporter substrate-binding domain-containing protein [Xanthobacter sp. SG618]NMN57521.1 polar amino acid transport system substrate-binding protein [Xanthobacter sp. SG618]